MHLAGRANIGSLLNYRNLIRSVSLSMLQLFGVTVMIQVLRSTFFSLITPTFSFLQLISRLVALDVSQFLPHPESQQETVMALRFIMAFAVPRLHEPNYMKNRLKLS